MITILGSCRQSSIKFNYKVTNIQELLTFPHYTKEIIQAIEYCKNIHTFDSKLSRYCFQVGIINKSVIDNRVIRDEFNKTDIFVLEIASRLSYKWNGVYVHHILTEPQYGFNEIDNIVIEELTDDEIEKDILKIRELLYPKKILIVSHIYTREYGKRYDLVNLLRNITSKYDIPFMDPSKLLKNIPGVYEEEPLLAHYTEKGNLLIGNEYKKIIDNIKDIDSLKVYKLDGKKVRLGSVKDGGYVIADNLEYDVLISCGIDNNIDFEEAFLEKYPNIQCFAFDGTIEKLPRENEKITFIKKNIGVSNTDVTTNLHELIDSYDNIFLKMDIETYEFRWLQTLSQKQMKRFKQIVIEFHFPFTMPFFPNLDIPTPVSQKMEVLAKCAYNHWLIHFHGNNCCSTTNYNNTIVPNVFECTYIRKDVQNFVGYNTDKIPSQLDTPNVPGDDICLNHYPFVSQNKKTLINVWKQEYNNLTQTSTSNFWGIGDLIRGSYGLYQLSLKLNCDFIIDISLHPMSKFLSHDKHIFSDLVESKQNDIEFILPADVNTYVVDKFKNEDVIFLGTNCGLDAYNNITTDEFKNIIKKVLTPNKELAEFINYKLSILPKNYSIIHYRIGDDFIINNRIDNNVMNKLYNHFINNYESNSVLISDSEIFKRHIKSVNQDVILFDEKISHLGYHNDIEGIKNTLMEFFLVTNASKIKSYTKYGWVSGFVYPIHRFYDIPLDAKLNFHL